MGISEQEIKDLITGYPDCPISSLLSNIHGFNGSDENIKQLYDILDWIETHEAELGRLRRVVKDKILDYRFKDVKV
ncbi:hypothetical protein KAI10_00350 [Candidatus Bathyarchaeota archaeon]|nr:hypothetical protein [Candidatus Bathyarchaeota archaeon]